MQLAPVRTGIFAAILAAALFGASTPLAKLLVGELPPVLLAGLLYLGSGLGLGALHLGRRLRRVAIAPVPKGRWPRLFIAIVVGGGVAPVLLMIGLSSTSGASAALLLNLEGAFTALIAWTLGRENADRRIMIGMLAVLCGGVVLSTGGAGGALSLSLGALAVIGASLAWAVDNNLTQAVSSADPVFVAALRGLCAGVANIVIAFSLGAHAPHAPAIAGALVVGFFGYGVSLVCFIVALRHVGAARTSAYFSLAPFLGAAASFVLLAEPLTTRFGVAALLMGLGVWIHVTERHEHEHEHEPITHAHRHAHDEHHQHAHDDGVDAAEPHTHEHTHAALTHTHAHAPDIHHRHGHGARGPTMQGAGRAR